MICWRLVGNNFTCLLRMKRANEHHAHSSFIVKSDRRSRLDADSIQLLHHNRMKGNQDPYLVNFVHSFGFHNQTVITFVFIYLSFYFVKTKR